MPFPPPPPRRKSHGLWFVGGWGGGVGLLLAKLAKDSFS
jgi:hypothetical protein